jgi:hypothetical protein
MDSCICNRNLAACARPRAQQGSSAGRGSCLPNFGTHRGLLRPGWRTVLLPLALLALCLGGVGCQTAQVQVRSQADPKADFSQFRTFNFAEHSSTTNSPQLTEQNWMRIRSAAVRELEKRGFQLADQPDLQFSIALGTSAKSYDKSSPSVESGSLGGNLSKHYGLVYNENLSSQPVVNYTEGTLSFRALDRRQDRLVWEGLAIGVLYQNRPDEQVQKRIQEAVEAVFAEFPVSQQRK